MAINIGEIQLRRPESKDVEAMYRYRNDPDIVAALGAFSKGYSRSDMLEWVERQRKSTDDIVWVIADAEDNCIGHCGLYQINSITGVAEIAICIGNSSFRRGQTGREVIIAVINYAFEQLNLRKIRGDVLSSNKISLSFTRKLGFKEECVLREQEYRNGQYEDVHVFGMFRCDWNPAFGTRLPA